MVSPTEVAIWQTPLSDEEVVARVLAGEAGMFEIVMRRHTHTRHSQHWLKLVPVRVIIRMIVPPIPVFRLLLALEMGEVAVVDVIVGRPALINSGFAIIPGVIVLVILIVVPLLIVGVPAPMFVALMLIVLKIGACHHPGWNKQSRPHQ